MEQNRNWAGNYKYSASELHIPETTEQVSEIVTRSRQIKVLGTRHSFNGIADCSEIQLSLEKLNRVINLDRENHRVTVEGGIRYGDLCRYLDKQGYALHNLASLPHITVAGACATATHGSGVRNGNLATAVHSLEIVGADGDVMQFSRDHGDGVNGTAVGLGGLGVVTKITLDIIPAFEVSQYVYENLPLKKLEDHFDEITSAAYSVSLFTDWKESRFNQVWLKHRTADGAPHWMGPEFFGAVRATGNVHPVPGYTAENCSEQMGIPGPWFERLPHFRMEFTPSAGEELQSEYFVPRQFAYQALCAIDHLREHISPLLFVSEVRTIAEDELWMSPCYKQDSVAIHFTWKPYWHDVQQVLPMIEERLSPFAAIPHWAKLFTMQPPRLQSLYERLPDFRKLLLRYDPEGKFRNPFLNDYLMAD
ncbi:FAD-binding protein [Paenibacillus sp. HJL G12]|uniref:FAD-binding protein n=1 Tax=Paenibacillus dendrobii TaxID=2691084 RepID=A0A7X3IFP9_9BACL|nr:FAD-binding protein [Paenibacillus dendrobii]MWV42733.1 FAD-binding protein [Paenibacillus dendrobii]